MDLYSGPTILFMDTNGALTEGRFIDIAYDPAQGFVFLIQKKDGGFLQRPYGLCSCYQLGGKDGEEDKDSSRHT